jgi:hypothetical protein
MKRMRNFFIKISVFVLCFQFTVGWDVLVAPGRFVQEYAILESNDGQNISENPNLCLSAESDDFFFYNDNYPSPPGIKSLYASFCINLRSQDFCDQIWQPPRS